MMNVSGAGSRIVFGLTLLGLGVLFLLSAFAGLAFKDTLGLGWPVLIIVVGIWQWASLQFRRAIWPVLIIAVGLILMAFKLHLLDLREFVGLLGVVLIATGFWLMIRRARPWVRPVSEADAIDHWVVFGGVEETLTSRQFSGGQTTVVFGGAEIDLRSAVLTAGDVPLTLTAFFGGIDLKVPDGWRVVVNGSAFLGGVEDKLGTVAPEKVQAGSRLLVRAAAIFGSIEVSR